MYCIWLFITCCGTTRLENDQTKKMHSHQTRTSSRYPFLTITNTVHTQEFSGWFEGHRVSDNEYPLKRIKRTRYTL